MAVTSVAMRNALATQYATLGLYLTFLRALTLAAAASSGATTVQVDLSVAVGDVIVFDKGKATEETRTVTAVSGSGPYTATVAALGFAHALNGLHSHLPLAAATVHEVSGITRTAANWGAASNGAVVSAPSAIAIGSGSTVGAVAVYSAVTTGTYYDAAAVPGQPFNVAGNATPNLTHTEV